MSTKFDDLVAYHAESGRFPTRSTPGGLDTWVGEQRTAHATMSAERKERLEALDGWAWRVRATGSV